MVNHNADRARRTLRGVAVLVAALAGCGGPEADSDTPSASALELRAGMPGPGAPCLATDAMVGLDHAIVAVHDLDPAVASYQSAGFRLKPGRPHTNGLLNAHVKLRDSTEVELMSVPGEPSDPIAAGYREFLRGGEGGAFVAFHVRRGDVLGVAAGAGVRAEHLAGQYIVFPELPRIFALRSRSFVDDPDSLLAHPNGAAGLAAVWLEGGDLLESLLTALGARPCGSIAPPEGVAVGPGEAFAVDHGIVVVIPPEDPERPVLRGIVLARAPGRSEPSPPPLDAHGVWISFQD